MKPIVLHVRHYLAYEPFLNDIVGTTDGAYEPVTLTSKRVPPASEPEEYRCYYLTQASAPWSWGWTVSGALIGLTGRRPYDHFIEYERVRALHAHYGPTGVWALPLRKRLKMPMVTSFYGYDASQHTRKWYWRALYRPLFQLGDCFLALGPAMREKLVSLGCPPEKAQVHRLGVDVSRIPFAIRRPPLYSQPVRVLMAGRLVEKKGFRYGITAFGQTARHVPHAELTIVGDGPLRAELMELIKKKELTARTRLLGAVPRARVFEEMQRAHLFVAPSVTAANGDQEGTPTVLLEAQATGLPVIATRHADIPSTLVEGESGYLVPERDSDALAQKMTQVLEEPGRWEAMGQAGRRHIETHFDIRQLSRSLGAIYQKLGGAG